MLTRSNLSVLIAIIILLGLILGLFDIAPNIGFYARAFGILIGFIYPFIMKDLSRKDRIIIGLMAGFTFIRYFAMMFHLPGASYYNLMMIVPMGLFVYVSYSPKNLKTEYPFLLMLAILPLLSLL
jgi:hypothetical protein